jgi:peroxiredoxin
MGPGREVIYIYPPTGRPGVDLPEGWDAIPGARDCSTEVCDFRDHFADLQDRRRHSGLGLSSQDPNYQAELAERLHLPFHMLSDSRFTVAVALNLPTFSAPDTIGCTPISPSLSATDASNTPFTRSSHPARTPGRSWTGYVRTR